MLEEIKHDIEKNVADYIEYIERYKPKAKNAKSAEYFSKMNIIKAIAANVYPQIYVDMINRFDLDEAKFKLKRMGSRVAKYYVSTNLEILKKHDKFPNIFIKIAKTEVREKLKFYDRVKEDGKLKSCKFQVKECIFCHGIPPFENTDIPYCVAKAGTYETIYNIVSIYAKDLEPRLVQIDTLKSAQDENDFCIYELTVID